jgi:hypothetical protein
MANNEQMYRVSAITTVTADQFRWAHHLEFIVGRVIFGMLLKYSSLAKLPAKLLYPCTHMF